MKNSNSSNFDHEIFLLFPKLYSYNYKMTRQQVCHIHASVLICKDFRGFMQVARKKTQVNQHDGASQ